MKFSKQHIRAVTCFFDCWKRHQITTRAAALTYTSILSVVPAIAVCVFLFAKVSTLGGIPQSIHWFLLKHLQEKYIRWVIEFTDFSDAPIKFKLFLIENLAAGLGSNVFEHLDNFISNVRFESIGVSGTIALLITSILLLFTIENSMNKVWCVPINKGFFRRICLYTLALIFAPLVLSISFTTSTLVTSFFPAFLLPAKIATFSSTTILMTFCLVFLPNTKVHIRPAFISAIYVSVGLELLKFAFGIYTKNALIYSALYGGMSALPFFLVWLYFNWMLFLSGCLLCFTLQNYKQLGKLGDLGQWGLQPVFDKERSSIIFELTKILEEKDLTLNQILKSINLPDFAVMNAHAWLYQKKWIRRRVKKMRTYYYLAKRIKEQDSRIRWIGILGITEAEIKKNQNLSSLQEIPK